MKLLIVSWGLLVLLSADLVAESPSCAELFDQIFENSMTLDYEDFDQTSGQGFRVLAGAGCPREAADLIERYVQVTGATQRSLTWHLAQMRGEAGQIALAIEAAEASLDPKRSADEPFRWNAHVQAYLALLKGDRDQFDAHLQTLQAAADDHRGNAMNASFWERLAPHFELGYAGALQAAYQQD